MKLFMKLWFSKRFIDDIFGPTWDRNRHEKIPLGGITLCYALPFLKLLWNFAHTVLCAKCCIATDKCDLCLTLSWGWSILQRPRGCNLQRDGSGFLRHQSVNCAFTHIGRIKAGNHCFLSRRLYHLNGQKRLNRAHPITRSQLLISAEDIGRPLWTEKWQCWLWHKTWDFLKHTCFSACLLTSLRFVCPGSH